MKRRQFLYSTFSAGGIGALAGCPGLNQGNNIEDTDGDGVIDSEDYAPRDPDVQERSDISSSSNWSTQTPASNTQTTPSPTVEFGAMSGLERPNHQISATVQLDGADRIVIEYQDQTIAAIEESGHQIIHNVDERPFISEGETLNVYAVHGGNRYKIRDWIVLGV